MLEGLVHRVIAQLFALSGKPGLGVIMRESVLVRARRRESWSNQVRKIGASPRKHSGSDGD